jgi:hypothetical protein
MAGGFLGSEYTMQGLLEKDYLMNLALYSLFMLHE